MRRGGRGEERDTTTHLIKFEFLPTLVVLLYLARLFQDESRESWSFYLYNKALGAFPWI